ncbi:65-kDa microtubule-associated protein 8 [Tanacetum coccineum]
MATRTAAMLETSCGYLLQELQASFQGNVDNANMSRARLHQELADSEAQFTHLLLSLDERSLPTRPEKMAGTLKEQLGAIVSSSTKKQIEEGREMNQFIPNLYNHRSDKISTEIAGLTLEKVKNYIITIQKLSATLGMDASMIITKVHPSLNELSGLSKNMSDRILAKLNSTVESLEAEKQLRIEKCLHEIISENMYLGEMDYADLLKSMDEQIARAEDEALSRKMIMEKVEKWALAREEERWLEEYNMVPLLALMKEYNMSRHEKEEDKQRRQRDKKLAQSKVVVLHESVGVPDKDQPRATRHWTQGHGRFKRVTTGKQFGTNVKSPNPNHLFKLNGKVLKDQDKMPPNRFDRYLKEDRASSISRLSSPFSP